MAPSSAAVLQGRHGAPRSPFERVERGAPPQTSRNRTGRTQKEQHSVTDPVAYDWHSGTSGITEDPAYKTSQEDTDDE